MFDFPETVPTWGIAAAMSGFLLKHLVADFLLQTNWMATGKERADGWFLPLTAHAGLHGVLTAAMFLAVAPPLAWFGVADAITHGVIDRAKAVVTQRAGLTPQRPAFWSLFGIDQTLHHLTHLVLAILMAASLAS